MDNAEKAKADMARLVEDYKNLTETYRYDTTELKRLLEVKTEDLRVTNESAHFHILECKKLREQINDLEREKQSLQRDLDQHVAFCEHNKQVVADWIEKHNKLEAELASFRKAFTWWWDI